MCSDTFGHFERPNFENTAFVRGTEEKVGVGAEIGAERLPHSVGARHVFGVVEASNPRRLVAVAVGEQHNQFGGRQIVDLPDADSPGIPTKSRLFGVFIKRFENLLIKLGLISRNTGSAHFRS